jgi:hypothetical protein
MEYIPAGSEIKFELINLTNPSSTEPSEPFKILVTDKNGYTIMKSSETLEFLKDMKLQSNEAAQMKFAVVD